MKLWSVIILVLFFLGCSDSRFENTSLNKAGEKAPAIQKGDYASSVGSQCAEGCIWSGYAVSMGAQESSNDCGGIPCACVKDGNAWELCQENSLGSNFNEISENENVSSSEVPYFFQYSNRLHPGSSCQNTSVAMVLSYLGWDGTPDDITHSWGKDFAQRPHNLSQMFNEIALHEDLDGRLLTKTNGTIEDFREKARTGNIMIVHGYFTSYGHVLVVTAFDGSHYTTNDPAGIWRQTFKGGYLWSGDTDGRGIQYEKSSFEAAISTSDGYSELPLWYHTLVY